MNSGDIDGHQYLIMIGKSLISNTMKTARIVEEDVLAVAEDLGITLTETELNWVLDCYEDTQRQDPMGTWDLVVEDLIYQAVEFRKKL